MVSCSHYKLKGFLLYSFSILMVLLSTDLSIAKQVTFEREYTYQASEIDSKVSCRVNALEQVKRLLLEELGTYLESRTEIRGFNLTKDQIITLTAGIVRTEIVKETWDGKTYRLKARIEADPEVVIKSVDSLRKDHQKTRELEETRRKAAEYLKEMERLRSELALAKGDTKKQKKYNEAVKKLSAMDWFEKGRSYIRAEQYHDAIYAYTEAIQLDPIDAEFYLWRGVAHVKSGNYGHAIADYTKAIELNPTSWSAYSRRADAYQKLGNHRQAIADRKRYAELIGVTYSDSGEYQKKIDDYTRTIELNPKDSEAYYNRGFAYHSLGNYHQAITDFTRAIELDPASYGSYFF